MALTDRTELAAFARLGAPETRGVVTYLEKARDLAVDGLVRAEDERLMRRLQGRAELARELLELVRDANQIIARLDK
jgi:hypothetical protein